MNIEKIYLDGNCEGYIVCKACGKTKKVNIRRDKVKVSKPIKVTCGCQNIFYIQFEQRRDYRKEVKLSGVFERIYPDTKVRGRMIIEDISMGGVGFRTIVSHDLNKDDILKLKFVLDDPHESQVEVEGIVRSAKESSVGVEFRGLDEHTRKILGFYLLC